MNMKLLLTSYGITTDKIANALNELTQKQPSETKIAFIPTAAHGNRGSKYFLVENLEAIKSCDYQLDIIEITAHEPDVIKNILNASDVIFFGGGNCFYLSYWMQKKGLFDFLPELLGTRVLAGISVGSMVAGANFLMSSQALGFEGELTKEAYNNLGPAGESSGKTLKLVDFIFKPHFNSQEHYEVRNADYIRSVSNRVNEAIYSVDDRSALKIIDQNVEVITDTEYLFIDKK